MTEHREYPVPEFLEAVRHDDDLAAVIRTQLFMEAQLISLIEKLLPHPQFFEVSKLHWPQKVDLARAFGLKEQYGPPLKRIGSIRNQFAHEPNTVVREKDANDLFSCLHESDKRIVLEAFTATSTQMRSEAGEFAELSARDRFTLIAVVLHSMLLAAVKEVTDLAEIK